MSLRATGEAISSLLGLFRSTGDCFATSVRSDFIQHETPANCSRVFVYNLPDMRKFIFILVLFFAAAFVYLSFGELESIARTLRQGNLWFILLAVLIEVAWLLVAGLIYQSIYHVLGIEDSFYRLSLLSAAATFVNIVAPSVGMGGIALFIRDAVRHGRPIGKVTIANMLW